MNQSAKNTQTSTIENDCRWAKIQARDSSADGTFYYSVSTTGIYCKPSCGARQPRPEHVAFYVSCAEAELAGFRACKRCKPDQPDLAQSHAMLIAESCRLIENADEYLNLAILAEKAGLSAYHFHRIFKAVTGLTPKEFSAAQRAKKVRNALIKSSNITDAIYTAGYNANSRFYEKSTQMLGMSPTNYKKGGANISIKFAVGECSLGAVLVASSERGVCAIFLGDDAAQLVNDLQDAFPRAQLIGADHDYEALVAKVVGFVERPALGLDLPLDIRGTAFQQRVWQALQKIPAGLTVSYSDIAERIGSPKAMRAVAGACAANTLAVAIPCHRVVRNDGTISDYRWGVERKRALLALESKK